MYRTSPPILDCCQQMLVKNFLLNQFPRKWAHFKRKCFPHKLFHFRFFPKTSLNRNKIRLLYFLKQANVNKGLVTALSFFSVPICNQSRPRPILQSILNKITTFHQYTEVSTRQRTIKGPIKKKFYWAFGVCPYLLFSPDITTLNLKDCSLIRKMQMTSRARVLSKLRAETHWLTWTNLCFFGISSKQRGLQEN